MHIVSGWGKVCRAGCMQPMYKPKHMCSLTALLLHLEEHWHANHVDKSRVWGSQLCGTLTHSHLSSSLELSPTSTTAQTTGPCLPLPHVTSIHPHKPNRT